MTLGKIRFMQPKTLFLTVLLALVALPCGISVAGNLISHNGALPILFGNNYGTANITWTAPGDDGNIGLADHYVIKYSLAPLDDSNWDQASEVLNPPAPIEPGQQQSYLVTNLYPGSFYYLAIKTYDEAGNVSPISNIASKYATGVPRPQILGATIDTANSAATLSARTVNSHIPIYYEFALDTTIEFLQPVIDIAMVADTTASVLFGSLQNNTDYFWRCRAMASDHSDSSHWSECDSFNIVMVDGIDPDGNMIPDKFMLEQSYPNPFNAAANIRYSLPKSSHVSLEIYDLLGNLVVTPVSEHQEAGQHQYVWKADQLPSGTYLYRLKAGEFVMVKKALLIK